MSSFMIDSRSVGPDFPPLVIAEIGINHGGSLAEAKVLVDSAHAAGAEIIKHQTHIVEEEMSYHAEKIVPDNANISIYEIMSKCSLSEEEEFELMHYVRSKGMIFISTPFSRAAVDRLERFKIPAYKIGSGECNNYPLIEYVASKGKPVILSTGMNSIASIELAVNILREYRVPYALLHCTNIYPTAPEWIRLGALSELKEAFPDAVIGLSDHSISNLACLGAIALGADVLERHFTDTKLRQGPDIVCSMDQMELKELLAQALIMYKMRGGRKGLVGTEKNTAKFAYASVVAIKPIFKGETFTHENLWVKRPGTGDFLAKDYKGLIGKKASLNITIGEQIQKTYLLEDI